VTLKPHRDPNPVTRWLIGQWQWPFAALFAAVTLLLLIPVGAQAAGTALALILMQLPLYMIHQWEEHTGDRFRKYLIRTWLTAKRSRQPPHSGLMRLEYGGWI
jgi:hypothetical protein